MKTLAFYLPQFHAIPENDEWWGAGFTEWTNVRRARPQFDGHRHPKVSTALGEYNLTDEKVRSEQSNLAGLAGIDGFCMYFYWFGGKRLLEKPVEAWRQDPSLLPYCLSWANESWTRRWDGKNREVLLRQDYADGFADRLFADLVPHFRSPHYIRQHGRPMLVVHRVDLIPNASQFAARLRELAERAGEAGIYLVAAETKPGISPSGHGFDAVVEFPPVGTNTLSTAYLRPLDGLAPGFRGRLMSYDRLASHFEGRASPAFIRHRAVAPGWDNTARRGSAGTIYVGSTPARYRRWLENARAMEERDRGAAGLVFVNAWNEWAEGAYLEPDAEFGDSYVRATAGRDPQHTATPLTHRVFWTYPQVRSIMIAAAGSVLSLIRRVRARTSGK